MNDFLDLKTVTSSTDEFQELIRNKTSLNFTNNQLNEWKNYPQKRFRQVGIPRDEGVFLSFTR